MGRATLRAPLQKLGFDDLRWAAIEAGVDDRVTGDRRHLLPVGAHRGVRIVTSRGLLAELL